MLVLSRKLGEKIYIGDNICITVVDIDRGKIRLGIEAPRQERLGEVRRGCSDEHAHLPPTQLRRLAAMLQSLPAHAEHEALLRIGGLCLPTRHGKEVAIEREGLPQEAGKVLASARRGSRRAPGP